MKITIKQDEGPEQAVNVIFPWYMYPVWAIATTLGTLIEITGIVAIIILVLPVGIVIGLIALLITVYDKIRGRG